MEYADVARSSSPRGDVVLRTREEAGRRVLELRVNGMFVMDELETSTERALATRALELVTDPRRILVGGLGLGFTARALLDDSRVEQVDVVEIEEAVVRWMRDGTIPGGAELLDDPRIDVLVTDLASAVATVPGASYDLVLLDVDNGPTHLVHMANAALYEGEFLTRCREIIHPDGVLVFWSANRAPRLAAQLRKVFGNSEELSLPVRLQDRDDEYLLYLARVTSSP